jgi:hypothetical protein
MRWESWAQFWDMGGYGLYVWGSMGMTALLSCLKFGKPGSPINKRWPWRRTESQDKT